MSIYDVKQAIENKFNDCYKIAESKGIILEPIRIDWSLRGTAAGQFCCRYDYDKIQVLDKYFRVNLTLAKDNLKEYLHQTVPHEFCHYLTFARLGKNVNHGTEWKKAMIEFFGLEPRRCHNYNVEKKERLIY